MPDASNVLRFLLRTEFDADEYARGWDAGTTPDRLPYGIEHAPRGWRFEIARRRAGSRASAFVQKAVRRVAGFDLLHAWVNRRFLVEADAVYCHSEVEYLGAAAILLLHRNRSTRLIGQTIWLFHGFADLPSWRRALLGRLLARVDVFVYNAQPNEAIGRALLPRRRHEYVPFGVSPLFREDCAPEEGWDVLSVGNDVSRDWGVLQEALEGMSVRTRLATSTKAIAARGAVVGRTGSVTELRRLYRGARVVVIAVQPNSHAGGITSLLEAAAAATPVVATRAGGLERYFDDDEVLFVEPGSADELRVAMSRLLEDRAEAARRGARMRERFDADAYSNVGYWERVTALLATVGEPATAAE